MEYEKWRQDIFGQPSSADPVMLDLLPETEALSLEEHFDHVDCALGDPGIHELFTPEQIGIGLQLIYSNCCGGICFCYIQAGTESRRIRGIHKLVDLYANYFSRYCLAPVHRIGYDYSGNIGYLCYMLWDIFVLYPGNASPAMISAAIEVMAYALEIENDQCLASAIHGLGHWVNDAPAATEVLRNWLPRPTTANPAILKYAEQAMTGCIL